MQQDNQETQNAETQKPLESKESLGDGGDLQCTKVCDRMKPTRDNADLELPAHDDSSVVDGVASESRGSVESLESLASDAKDVNLFQAAGAPQKDSQSRLREAGDGDQSKDKAGDGDEAGDGHEARDGARDEARDGARDEARDGARDEAGDEAEKEAAAGKKRKLEEDAQLCSESKVGNMAASCQTMTKTVFDDRCDVDDPASVEDQRIPDDKEQCVATEADVLQRVDQDGDRPPSKKAKTVKGQDSLKV
jgi:hypothetical protein